MKISNTVILCYLASVKKRVTVLVLEMSSLQCCKYSECGADTVVEVGQIKGDKYQNIFVPFVGKYMACRGNSSIGVFQERNKIKGPPPQC